MSGAGDPVEDPAPPSGAAALAQEGVLALVAAARAALDALERAARDPEPVLDAVVRAADLGREAALRWASAAAGEGDGPRTATEAATAPGAGPARGEEEGPPRRPRVERISVDAEPDPEEGGLA